MRRTYPCKLPWSPIFWYLRARVMLHPHDGCRSPQHGTSHMNATVAAAKSMTPSKTLGFVTLFLIEMWERFGYYGMTAVIVLYMVHQLGYSDDRANLTFGAFTAMAYAVPAVGGWIGDRVLGSKRTSVVGASFLTLGYILLSLPVPVLMFPALAIVAV